jgi:hypothetical protein
MGIFGKKSKPSKAGTYTFQWPAASGLGQGPYGLEAERQEEYLVYTSKRRKSEGVAQEDAATMAAASTLLQQIGIGDDLLLTAGPVDLRSLDTAPGNEFSAQAAVTDRHTVLWWSNRRGYQDEYLLLPHQNLKPKVEGGFGFHFVWIEGGAGGFPATSNVRRMSSPGFALSPHFSQDGHGNRRGASVQSTLQHVRGDS